MERHNILDEKGLLVQLRSGDHSAFELLYRKYSPILFLRIRRLVHSIEVAEELVQDVFLQIWRRRERIDLNMEFSIIISRTAKSIAIDHYRKNMLDEDLRAQLIKNATAFHDPLNESLDFKETNAILNEVIAKLPPQRQKVFILCKLQGKSYEFAADEMQVSVGTIKDHMTKALSFIRKELRENQAIPPYYLLGLLYFS